MVCLSIFKKEKRERKKRKRKGNYHLAARSNGLLSTAVQAKRRNIYTLSISPHGSNFPNIITALKAQLLQLGRGLNKLG